MLHNTNDGLLHYVLHLGRGVRDVRATLSTALYLNELSIVLNPDTYQPEVTIQGYWSDGLENAETWLNKVKNSIYFDAWHAMEEISLMFDYYRSDESKLDTKQIAEIRYQSNLKRSGEVYYGTKIWKAILDSTFVTDPNAEQPEFLRPYAL